MNKDQINRKVEETLNSINNLERAVPDDRLFYKIENRVKNIKNKKEKEFSYTGKFALAFAILLIINIFSIIGYKNNHRTDELKTTQNVQSNSKIINEFAKEYFFDTNEYYNYK
jgi:hypothetical protein